MSPTPSGMDEFFAGMALGGTTEASGLGFTLESAKAREKLQQFALAQPDNYQLLAIAGLYALGSRNFAVTIDADDFIVEADQPLPREPFGELWTFVSRGSEDAMVSGCRMLAMALLTSVRLGEMVWKVESNDAVGSWEYTVTVRQGKLSELPPAPREVGGRIKGLRLWAKRKSKGQIVLRYLNNMVGQTKVGIDHEKRLLAQRLFLPQGSALVVNGQPTAGYESSSSKVLAVLRTGNAPTLVDCANIHQLERDYSLCVLLCDPKSIDDSRLPGASNATQWIWNGLRMDSTALGGELRYFRAFVWASELRPDLSFTSLVDNRDKQTLERTVRSMARELLDRYTRGLTADILSGSLDSTPYGVERAMICAFIAERIDLRTDPGRLASLNRALIDCPVFVGSKEDGVRRWVTFREIWAELREGRPLAAFLDSLEDVPAWPDRPLVLYLDLPERDFLLKRFPNLQLLRGESLLAQVKRMLPDAPVSKVAVKSSVPSVLAGATTVDGCQLDWSYPPSALQELMSGTPPSTGGTLAVRTTTGGGYVDSTLGLPKGFTANVRADWKASYKGMLSDAGQRVRVTAALLESYCQQLAARQGDVGKQDRALAAALLVCRDGPAAGVWESGEWLLVTSLKGGLSRTSPAALLSALKQRQAPAYVVDWPPAELDSKAEHASGTGYPAGWTELPIVVAPPEAEVGLSNTLGQRVQKVEGISLLIGRPPHLWSETGLLWSSTLEGEEAAQISPDLISMTLGIPRQRAGLHRKMRLTTLLQGYHLGDHDVDCPFPFLRARVDWATGYPDSKASERRGVPLDNVGSILQSACLKLAERFFLQASLSQLFETNGELLGGFLFDLLAEPGAASLPLLTLAGGARVSLAGVPVRNGSVGYFSKPEQASEGSFDDVYLPGALAETIAMLSSFNWIDRSLPVAQTTLPSVPPSSPAAEVPPADPHKSAPVAVSPSQVEPPSAQSSQKPLGIAEVYEGLAPLPSPVEDPAPLHEIKPAVSAPSLETEDLNPTGLKALIADFKSLASQQEEEIPHASRFAQWLVTVALDSSVEAAVSSREGRIVLGRPTEKALKTPPGRVFLLSALYSALNRAEASVEDSDERQFHTALLGWASKVPAR